MVSRRTDRLLQKITHHTNLEQPYSEFVSGIKYPAQDTDKVGKLVLLRYKNRYNFIVHDRVPNNNSVSSNDIDIMDIYENLFLILRFDKNIPNKMIAISTDYNIIIVGDTRTYKDIVHVYPQQIEEFLGLYMHDQYFNTPDIIIKSVLLRCDSTEPCESVIAEFYLDNKIRFVTGTETQAVVLDRYDIDGVKDYNAMDSQDHSYVYIDLNGKYASSEGESITLDADGGYPDPLADMYRNDILTFDELASLRSRIIQERDIYV